MIYCTCSCKWTRILFQIEKVLQYNFQNVLMKLFTEKCSDQKLNDILNKIQRKNEGEFSVCECRILKRMIIRFNKCWSILFTQLLMINLSKDNMTYFKGGIIWKHLWANFHSSTVYHHGACLSSDWFLMPLIGQHFN